MGNHDDADDGAYFSIIIWRIWHVTNHEQPAHETPYTLGRCPSQDICILIGAATDDNRKQPTYPRTRDKITTGLQLILRQ